VMTRDVEAALFRRNVARNQGNRNIDIPQHAAVQAMHVIVPLDTPIVSTGLIRECQFLDQSVFR